MKKKFYYLISLVFIVFCFCACSQKQSTSTPEGTVEAFLKGLQHQQYASTESYYAENMDNMANFRNQVEDISPHVATELFKKMADFSYTIGNVTFDSIDSNKALVNATITAYDLGPSFEQTVLDYIKSDIKMTFEGAESKDIIKSVEDTLVTAITNAQEKFTTSVQIGVTKTDDTWQVDKISDNVALMNALSGNIMYTIDRLSEELSSNS